MVRNAGKRRKRRYHPVNSRSQSGVVTYDESFFTQQGSGSLQAAGTIVPLVLELVEPRSVIDVGCGLGSWAATFLEQGVADVVGVDGDYVNRERLLIPSERFIPADLTRGIPVDRQFDLAVCLEVAEHLPANCGDQLVDELARLGRAVLFSAAIPHQGGTGALRSDTRQSDGHA